MFLRKTIGAQIGRLRAAPLEAADRRDARDFLQRATTAKDRYYKFLNLGEMRKPPMLSEVPLITTKESTNINHICFFDSVLASAWRSTEGSAGLAVTNMGEKAQAVTAARPFRGVHGAGRSPLTGGWERDPLVAETERRKGIFRAVGR